MCTVCGCDDGEARIEGQSIDRNHPHTHTHADGTTHTHTHADGTTHTHAHHDHQQGNGHSHFVAAAPDKHVHYHRHADGSWHTHDHGHDHDHAHGHANDGHEHNHSHDDGVTHSHFHGHGSAAHDHDHGTAHTHSHDHDHSHGHSHIHQHGDDIHYGAGPAHAHVPGMSQARMVQIERDILSKNNDYAGDNRRWLADHGVFAVNFVSSPGSGKTTLLVRTINEIKARLPVAVVEGDQQTSFDAERIRTTGVRAVQVNTGKGCHLDAQMVGKALEHLELPDDALLLIENVGNLVCPAAFDLGEAHKVVILSVTEGEDKPLKYPDMFRAASVMLLNKVDLLPHLTFNANLAIEYARRVNPDLKVIRTSSTSGEGFEEWLNWLEQGVKEAGETRDRNVGALRARIAQLEAQLNTKA